jgi:histidinol phosphatase-like enzyme
MYRRAEAELHVDLSRSFYVGDRWRDVAVTESVGGVPFLVRTGAGGQGAPDGRERVDDLAEASDRILASLASEDAD